VGRLTVFLTGATGVIGSRVVGHDVVSANLATSALACGAARFIQESFAPIYEDAGDAWIDERGPIRVARYNRSVLHAERAAERVTPEGVAGVVLRFAYFYGADSDFTRGCDTACPAWLGAGVGVPQVLHFVGIARRRRRGRCGGARCTRGNLQRLR